MTKIKITTAPGETARGCALLKTIRTANAVSRTVDTFRPGLQLNYYKIEVGFLYKNTVITKTSGNGETIKSYYKTFRIFADKEINILYSPKYDEVLILKK